MLRIPEDKDDNRETGGGVETQHLLLNRPVRSKSVRVFFKRILHDLGLPGPSGEQSRREGMRERVGRGADCHPVAMIAGCL